MKFLIIGRREIENDNPIDEDHIIISIHDPELNPAKTIWNKHTLGQLTLSFHDVEEDEHGFFKLIEDNHVLSIVDFVIGYENKVDCIICNCEAGISRSSGVACALSTYFNGFCDHIYEHPRYNPNKRVENMITKALLERKDARL